MYLIANATGTPKDFFFSKKSSPCVFFRQVRKDEEVGEIILIRFVDYGDRANIVVLFAVILRSPFGFGCCFESVRRLVV